MQSYRSFGDNGRPAILFIHGGSVASWFWEYQIKHFQNSNYCISIDLPDHGENAGTPLENVDAVVDEILRITASLRLRSICVVGHSLGAKLAVKLIARSPRGLVASAVFCGAYFGSASPTENALSALLLWAIARPVFSRAFARRAPFSERMRYLTSQRRRGGTISSAPIRRRGGRSIYADPRDFGFYRAAKPSAVPGLVFS